MIEQKTTHELGLVVVDEIHFVGEPVRGATLELLLTQLQFLENIDRESTAPKVDDPDSLSAMAATVAFEQTLERQRMRSLSGPLQIIGLTATLCS